MRGAHTIHLTPEDERYVREQIDRGSHPDLDAVIRDALRAKRELGEDRALDEEVLPIVEEADAALARGDYQVCRTREEVWALVSGRPKAE